MFIRSLASLTALLASPFVLKAELRVPHILSSHMVLQRDQPIHLWGWTTPGSSIQITFAATHAAAQADSLGRWSLFLPAQPASAKPASITLEGDGNRVVLEDVLIGDLWLASGQSNMEMPLRGFNPTTQVDHGVETAAAAHDPHLRLLLLPHVSASQPLEDTPATWQTSSPETAREFSAVAFFFAEALRASQKVPIGVIDSTWGGTPAEAWVSAPTLAADASLLPVFQAYARFTESLTQLPALREIERREDQQAAASGSRPPSHPYHPDPVSWQPSGLFNAMIAPLTPLPIRGVLWYQGESNASLERAPIYAHLFATLIEDWRTQWHQGAFPFLYAQISSYRGSPTDAWGVLRDAQRRALALRNTGMAVTLDIGDPTNIHPADKQTVAARLAGLAEDLSYAPHPSAHSPAFLRADPEGPAIRLRFDQPHLVCRVGCQGFEVAGADHRFVPAQARPEPGSILVQADAVPHPVFVRYAWPNVPIASLFSQSGLPVSTFTSEDDLSGPTLRPTSYGQTGVTP